MTREEAINEIKSWDFLEGKEIEAIHTLIPELRESEDERIRKEIVGLIEELQRSDKYFAGVELTDMLAYLEKQKESGIKWLKSDNVKNPEKPYIDKAGMFYTTDGRMCYASEIEKQKEQKPVESISQLTVQGKGVYKICPRCKERMVRDDSMVYTSMPPQYRYECPKCGESECDTVMYDNPEMEEQKPAECKDCAMFLKDKCERPGGKCEKKNQKLSWSEEDEERLKAICTYLQDYPRLAKINDVKRFNEYCDWLKSLHPSWKPSEEQMKALLNAEGKMRETKFIAIASKLAGLYEDLKKLIGEK